MSQVTVHVTTLGFNLGVTKRGVIKNSTLGIQEYSKKFERWNFDRSQMRWVLLDEFYMFDKDSEICYFPRYDLDNFLNYLKEHSVEYKVIFHEGEVGKAISFHMLPHITYKNDKQKNAIEFLTDDTKGSTRGLALQTGVGKGSTLDALIRTPEGPVRMGDIKLYQTVVTPDGGTAKVIGIYPQGLKDVYKVNFEDGRSTECDDDHLWKVHYTQWEDGWRVLDLKTLRTYMTCNPTYKGRLYVPLIEPEIKDDVDLPIDPYVLGVILGDGAISQGDVNIYKPELISDMESLGLMGKLSYNKFIPEIYMNASPRQRLALVQGLMDTGGDVSRVGISRNDTTNADGVGNIEYCTTSETMARQVQELIRSLGGSCKLKEKIPYYTRNWARRQGRLAYILKPRMKVPSDLFGLPHKKENVTGSYQYADNLKLRIKSIEYVGQKETQCIMIDHPDHLYIVDDYIVTHNTVSYIWALQRLGKRSMTTMISRLEQWVKELSAYTTLDEDDIYVVQGVASLTKLFSQIDKQLKPKIILASTKTIRLYIEYGPSYQHLPHPSLMCEKLGIGVVGTDEYHEHFYTNFLIGIVLNPSLFIPITATFMANDPFVKGVFNNFIPNDKQFTGGEYDRFVNVTAYMYESGGHLIKPYNYMARGGYSQVAFENFLMSKKGSNVLTALINDAFIPIVRNHYINIAEPGEKFLFLCATKEFGTHVKNILAKCFTHKTLSTFYSGMNVNILEKFDMIFSTPGSAGTGRDIKGLRTCFVFDNTASDIRNLQYLGRLRGPPQMMNEPMFVTLGFQCIPQHRKYNDIRSMLIGPRAIKYTHCRLR